MSSVGRTVILALGCALWLCACGGGKPASENPSGASGSAGAPGAAGAAANTGKVLNLFIWSDYLAPNTLSDFEKQTGIKVHVAYFDTNETLETKLLAGSSGYDIVVPTASYFERQIKAGVYLPLDKSKLPNLKNMDPQLMARVAMLDPEVSSKIAKCGISVLDSPAEMMRAVLSYLGRDPNSQKPEDLAAAEATLMKIRPYISQIDSVNYVQALANGE